MDYIPGDRIELVKNENYWNAEGVEIDKIICYTTSDYDEHISLYNSGKLDVISKIKTIDLKMLEQYASSLHVLPKNGVYYYSINVNVEPFNDVRVRKALALAIDREHLIQNYLKGLELPATSMVSSISLDNNNEVFAYKYTYGIPYDSSGIEEAQSLLAEAGYPNGEGFPIIQIKHNVSEGHKVIANAIKGMWKTNLNIEVEILDEDWEDFKQTRSNGDFEISRAGWIGDYSDPIDYLGMFTSSSPNNYSNWVNEQYTSLIESSFSLDGEERFSTLYKALAILMNDMPYIPIYNYVHPVLVSDNVQYWEINSSDLWYFGQARLKSGSNIRSLRPPEYIKVLNLTPTSFDIRWENTEADYYKVQLLLDNREWIDVINYTGNTNWMWKPDYCIRFTELTEDSHYKN